MYSEFHRVLTECLAMQHGARPVHSCSEMHMLKNLFPEQIDLWVVQDEDGQILAGAWVFLLGKMAWHTQYIASTEAGRERQAVDLLLESVIRTAEGEGVRYFSFGASTELRGAEYNSGLFNFKAGFGFGAITQDTYQVKAKNAFGV